MDAAQQLVGRHTKRDRMKDKSNSATPERLYPVSAGLAVAALGAILQFLQLQQLSRRLVAAVCLFAGAIPLLIACWSHYLGKHHKQHEAAIAVDITFLIAALAVAVGFGFVFFQVSTIGGIVFIFAVLVAIVLENWTS